MLVRTSASCPALLEMSSRSCHADAMRVRQAVVLGEAMEVQQRGASALSWVQLGAAGCPWLWGGEDSLGLYSLNGRSAPRPLTP